jgi:hypothetical protein
MTPPVLCDHCGRDCKFDGEDVTARRRLDGSTVTVRLCPRCLTSVQDRRSPEITT